MNSDGINASWKGMVQFGGVLTVLGLLWALFRAASAIQDTPTKLDAVIAAQKVTTDTVNKIANSLVTVSRDLGSLQGRMSAAEGRLQTQENKASAMEAATAAADRLHQDFSDRLREIEMRGAAGSRRAP